MYCGTVKAKQIQVQFYSIIKTTIFLNLHSTTHFSSSFSYPFSSLSSLPAYTWWRAPSNPVVGSSPNSKQHENTPKTSNEYQAAKDTNLQCTRAGFLQLYRTWRTSPPQCLWWGPWPAFQWRSHHLSSPDPEVQNINDITFMIKYHKLTRMSWTSGASATSSPETKIAVVSQHIPTGFAPMVK